MTTTAPDVAETIEVRNPADGGVVGQVPNDSQETVVAKVKALREAQPAWEALGPKERRRWFLRLQEWVLDNSQHITDVLQSETGKSRVDASFEPVVSADLLNYWSKNAAKFLADKHPHPHGPLGLAKNLEITYRPYPVVGVITPWNFPFLNGVFDAIPALAAGASVLLKPSEVTPLSAVEFVRGWKEIGAPPVLEISTGYGATGAALVDTVDYVQFTGSTPTGRIIAQQCAARLVPYSLELGGKDPAIVLADADLDRAANGIAWGGFFNAGQVCISIERVYVEESVYDEFLTKLTKNVDELRMGQDDRSYRYDVGALATVTQRDIVQRHVEEAVAGGARIVTGGAPTGVGTFFAPTVLADVEQSMSCIQEETFGPTLPVVKVRDEQEAIALANDSRYGLSASVWTRDKQRGQRIARQLEAGAVNINDAFSNTFNFALPMGGWKESGIGARWGGPNGILKYCRQQAITTPRIPVQSKELIWYPYVPAKVKTALALMRAGAAKGRRRLGL
ncbi:aldehyde dehydrogenase family protein [Gordonia rhizosphera]|uniref:Aldehyde dehydrogenase n=1 Tax=Gordonia rhizosphera NBRC 16068 TaxID=1108045 RepID=K6WWB6_9ACTN|nr:aldehyde dehydrogenase family protein [Gordonia rhizosphera]GAB90819.1 putative aldehyde dehydrogenase [Gordonia rhizosphera NBRC 16068]